MKINYKKLFKYSAITLLTIIVLLIATIFSLKIPAVQNFIKDRLVVYLEDKIKTKVELERVYIDFPNSLVMENLYLQGEDVDTLLFAKKLDVGLDILQLIDNKADLTSIELNTARANVVRKKDGSFNFDYIINAFVTKEEEETTSKPFIISLDKIKLQNVGVSFIDQQAGNNINVFVNAFDTRVKKFDLQQNSYAIDKISLDGLKLRLKQDLVQEVAAKVEQKVDSLNQQKPMQLALGEIDLKNFDIYYGDDQTKMYAHLQFKEFNTSIKKLDIEDNNFAVGDINLNGLKLKFIQKLIQDIKESETSSNTTSTPLKIALNRINLEDITIDYGDERSKTYAKLALEKLNAKINAVDLEKNKFDIDEVLLSNTNLDAKLHLQTSNSASNNSSSSAPMELKLGKGILDNVKINYNNTAAAKTAGLDYNHLTLNKLAVDLRDFQMLNGQFSGKVKSAELKERKGLHVQQLRTNFLYGTNQAYLKDLYLQTPRTIIRDEVILNYRNINELTNNIGNVTINADLNRSKISFADILFLVPSLRQTTPFKEYQNATLAVDTELYGRVNDLTIKNLSVSGLDDLKINASGRVQNAMNMDQLAYDLSIKNFSTSSKTIYKIVPKNTIPNNIRIPSQLTLKGKAKGTLKVIQPDLYLTSTLGNASVKGLIDIRKTNAEKYNLNAQFDRLDVGTLISNQQVGKITGNVSINGQSFDLARANTSINGKIKQAKFNQYNYQNLALKGKINNGIFDVNAVSDDPNANLNLTASGDFKKDLKNVKLNGNIGNLNIKALNFYDEALSISGEIDGAFDNLDFENPNGYLSLKNLSVTDETEKLAIDEMKLNAISSENQNQITLESKVINAEIKGKFNLLEIAPALVSTINQYYEFQDSKKISKFDPNQYFTLNANINNDKLVQKFLPDLKEFSTLNITGDFNAQTKKINLDGDVENLIYGNNFLKNAKISLSNPNETLNYKLNLDEVGNESFKLNNIDLNGDIYNNKINLNASSKDETGQDKFYVAGNVQLDDDIIIASLNPNGLILNYDAWQISEDNQIKISDKGIVANNFKISNNESSIELNSETDSPTSPLNVAINNFKIETITELIKIDELPASGTINGTAQLNNLMADMTFTADLDVTDLKAYNNPVGNLAINVKNKTSDIISADALLTGNDNDVRLIGEYNLAQSLLDFRFNMNRFELKTIKGFTNGMVDDIEGFLNGNLNLKGSLDNPSIEGLIGFNQVGFSVPEYGVNFRNITDNLNFTKRGIEFDQFKINDKDGNSLRLDGQILTTNYQDFDFNIDLRARDFKVINSEKSAQAMTYGTLAINTDLAIRGNLDLPVVTGDILITDQSDFTFVMPKSTTSLQSHEGIVEFIDPNATKIIQETEIETLPKETNIKGVNLSVNIDIDPEAKSTIIIDPINGDYVELQGEAQLTGGMDPSGRLSLTGIYEVEKGTYEMSVSMIKRKFDITKGSTITWTGEPMSANLNLTAVYRTQTAPIDLVEQQLTGLSSAEVNMYRQRIPFNTELKIGGELEKPEISFDITLDETNNSVATTVIENTKAKLNQLRNDEAEMNKQVFALLILNRFVGNNPFQSQSGVSAETMARQSVSSILSDQLNNLAADLIQGVDINLGLNSQEDYSTGEKNTRTDLNVEVSKRLLNDRLKVSIGSNFGLEGDARANENMTNIAGDINLEYSLSKNGRYMLRAYRKNEYQVALQGQIIETGVGFIITLDYDKFREIFEKKKKNEAIKKQMKIQP
nr:translocation/assembly module TamB domain-containing protein [Faecalibacter bovis]